MARIALLSLHTSPLAQPGSGDSGGMNVYVREMAAGLAHAGHRCDVYVRTDAEGLPAEVAVEPGVTVHHVPAGAVDMPKEELPAVVDEWAAAVAAAIVARGGVDVLHANYWLSGVAGHRIKHLLDVPLVSTFHTLARVKTAAGDPEPESRAQAELAVMACSDAVLASCDAEARQLVDLYGVPRSRIAVVPPGVEHALFSPGPRAAARQAAGLDVGEAPVALFVGRFQRLKGLDVAVQALDLLWARNTVLVACGGPSGVDGAATLAGVEAFVADRGLGDRVRFLAPRPHHQLSSLYRAADVVVVPSRSESYGLVALEAAACGRPVVAADVGGLSTLVDHRRTGLLVGSRGPVAWAEAIDSLLCLPERATRMGRAAAELAAGSSWSTAARALAGVYADVTARGPLDCAA
ncbi:glycosyltransferase [Iamia sp. SCSIO 61187]|uniref:glycosyltransferase n=1 Tax=Iamia sp. SCSIO 61187 TaxID=2722752 RepID=UPI001C639487|nr:glycosyltransferase [Iamia sp. SCSIO 61187]QYG94847.1 glycosyltransferase [Iamia sp. SCSIO 61187]